MAVFVVDSNNSSSFFFNTIERQAVNIQLGVGPVPHPHLVPRTVPRQGQVVWNRQPACFCDRSIQVECKCDVSSNHTWCIWSTLAILTWPENDTIPIVTRAKKNAEFKRPNVERASAFLQLPPRGFREIRACQKDPGQSVVIADGCVCLDMRRRGSSATPAVICMIIMHEFASENHKLRFP